MGPTTTVQHVFNGGVASTALTTVIEQVALMAGHPLAPALLQAAGVLLTMGWCWVVPHAADTKPVAATVEAKTQ